MKTVIYSIKRKRNTRYTVHNILNFLVTNFFRKKILVIDRYGGNPRISKRANLLLRWLAHFRVIKLIAIRNSISFYTDNDYAIVDWANQVASTYAPQIMEAIHHKNDAGFQEYSNWNNDIEKGLELAISDDLYKRLRRTQHILDLCKIKEKDEWIDYKGSLLDIAAWSQNNFAFDEQAAPVCLKIDDKLEYSTNIASNYLNSLDTEISVDTLIFNSPITDTYLATAIDISRAEARNQKVTALFYAASPLRYKSFLKYREEMPPFFFYPNPESSYYERISTLITANLEIGNDHSRQSAPCKITIRDIPAFNGMHAQLLNVVVGGTLIDISQKVLPRIILSYMSFRQAKCFSKIETCICNPSRSPYFIPIIEFLRSRKAKIIEYQPFFWSAHPRYIVRNVDLFVCSDRATEKIVKDKYKELQLSVPVITGPAFSLERFRSQFCQTQGSNQSRLIGIALQPQGLDQFLIACAALKAKGFDLLIRPHPHLIKNKNNHAIQQFMCYGTVDSDASLEQFIASCSVIVTGFSNVALQAAYVGTPAVCFSSTEATGLDLSLAHELITLCPDIKNIASTVEKLVKSKKPELKVTVSAEEQWLRLRNALQE